MEYTIRRAPSPLGEPTADGRRALWAAADQLAVTHFPWEDSGHRPGVRARVLWDEGWLGLLFEVDDRYVRATAEKFNDSVCCDSCVEFFVAPSADPEQNAYFNFEVNCGGTILLHRCASSAEKETGRKNENVTDEDGATIRIAHTLPRIVDPEIAEATNWSVEYHVPWSLFETYFGAVTPVADATWRANFYKCADRTSHPHWGSWSPVDTPRPNFHQPDSFQLIHFAG
ncbi:MAG: carbohydrate-binding family 9-like protein [Candidatus Latescibacteria bacterium]|jgi:hypothetical protein|nr:carbohydrate-binding family 9-like protein [Candidatus Latescibacterota bacterium]